LRSIFRRDHLHERISMLGAKVLELAIESVGVSEETQNRGPEVDKIVRDGGGSPSEAPPWCAYFVCAMVFRAEKELGLSDPGRGKRISRTGSAVGLYQKSNRGNRKVPREVLEHMSDWGGLGFVGKPVLAALFQGLQGAVMSRTRLSGPVSDREKAFSGRRVKGHAGIVEKIWLNEERKICITCICGNSTGDGHAEGTGSVARETIIQGDRAWKRLVGLVVMEE
jgi:hypothetical protein